MKTKVVKRRGTTAAVSYDEPVPHHSAASQSVTDQVLADLEERRQFGIEKYGVELMTFNSRPALIDAYQEALDLVLYLRQAIMEMEVLDLQAERESTLPRGFEQEDQI